MCLGAKPHILYACGPKSFRKTHWPSWKRLVCGALSNANAVFVLSMAPWDIHMRVFPLATFLQPFMAHFLPPPCRTQKCVLDCALLVQLSALHLLPPPWVVHLLKPPTANLLHPASLQRLPPPWAAQNCLSLAPLLQLGCWQRRPPPCEIQNRVLPCAHLEHPVNSHLRGPQWLAQYGVLLAAGSAHPSILQHFLLFKLVWLDSCWAKLCHCLFEDSVTVNADPDRRSSWRIFAVSIFSMYCESWKLISFGGFIIIGIVLWSIGEEIK